MTVFTQISQRVLEFRIHLSIGPKQQHRVCDSTCSTKKLKKIQKTLKTKLMETEQSKHG